MRGRRAPELVEAMIVIVVSTASHALAAPRRAVVPEVPSVGPEAPNSGVGPLPLSWMTGFVKNVLIRR